MAGSRNACRPSIVGLSSMVLLSFVIGRAAQVVVSPMGPDVPWSRKWLSVEVVAEDRLDALVGKGPGRQRTDSRGLHARCAVLGGKPHDAEARSEALLGVGPARHDR